ncbi:MAG TPA: NfeD family protein [Campylobacterales bacterium]|nr:NfeD family protein [Campylobacterales bacterium]
MLELLSTELLWWHWIAFGLFLVTSEIFIGTFMMLGLGVAAMLVGVTDNLFKTSLETELLLWIILSILSLVLWFKYLKNPQTEDSGQSNYTLDTLGVVTKEITHNGRGQVQFDTPVLGNTNWFATSKEDISEGSRVAIVEVKGQLIEVKKA